MMEKGWELTCSGRYEPDACEWMGSGGFPSSPPAEITF